jgi:pyruvate,water dikinase
MSNQQQNSSMADAYVLPFEQLRMTDVESVGGKNASLGEMISQLATTGVRVPTGFATTALAFRDFLEHNHLTERIQKRLENLNIDDVRALAEAGAEIRQWIETAPFQSKLDEEIRRAFATLDDSGKGSFAVRSSATAED